MNDSFSEKPQVIDLEHLSRRTGLIVRTADGQSLAILFDRLAKYDANERAQTFDYLKQAIDETRSALGAEPVFKEEFSSRG
jgi:hypothetical protein